MVRPESVLVQEIKVVPAKAKIVDMVAVRHAAGGGHLRTTLILLCEDGSLRIYMAGTEASSYWLGLRPPPPPVRAARRRKAKALAHAAAGTKVSCKSLLCASLN
jgi:E3 ubiquitin-protein ligase UBR4